MKKRSSVLSITLSIILVLFTGCYYRPDNPTHSHESYSYTEDYPVIYADELRQIFGDYSISEREECYVRGADCSCGYHQDEIHYYQWTITYKDCCGQTMECVMKNSSPFYPQQFHWLDEQLEAHIYTQYISEFYGNNLQEQKSWCFCVIGDFCKEVSSTDYRSQYRFDTSEAYRKSIEQEERIIHLSSMSYDELISSYPMVFNINLVMNPDSTLSEEEFNSISDDMGATLAADLGEDFNAEIHNEDCEDNWIYWFCIVRGDIYYHLDLNFESTVFESYVGEYW